jgi:indolepyruvate ferredoxin oxidoreductase
MKARVSDEVGAEDCFFLDASRIATALLGDSIAGNLFMLGVAWQRGLVPVSAAALERAIELNAVAVDFNKKAFLYGRRFANRPDQVLALIPERERLPLLSTDELIADRAERLTEYQDAAYAERFRRTVAAVKDADPHAVDSDSLTATAARALYKLMAYKDEYEVARLYSRPEFTASIKQRFEGDYHLRFNLAPPLWTKRDPHSGEPQKREFGSWMLSAFRLLAPFRRLRGTALDVFGYTSERQRERRDIAAYEQLLSELLPTLGQGFADRHGSSDTDYDLLRELLALPLQLRGFGHVKDRNRDQLLVRQQSLLSRLQGRPEPVHIVEAA